MTSMPKPTVVRRTGTSVLGLLLATSACLPLQAQTSPQQVQDDEDVVILSEFTVSSDSADRYRSADAISAVRVRAPLIDTPSSISVITRDMIDDLGAGRLFDATRYVAGVQEGRGIQFQDRMILRGFESNGQRTVDNFIQPDDADNISEILVDRIEVTKGPNAILSPAGAPGGSINVILKAPLYQQRRSVSATVGLYDAQKLTLDVSGPFSEGSPMAYRLVGAFQDSRRYWDDEAKIKNKVLAPMISYRFSDTTMLTAKLVLAENWIFREPLLILDDSVDAGTGDPYLAPNIKHKSRNHIQPWSHVGTHTADLFLQLTTKLADKFALRVAANGRYYFEDSEQEFINFSSLPQNRYNPTTGEATPGFTWANVEGAWVSTPSPWFNPAAIPVRGDKQATRRKNLNFQADLAFTEQFGEVSSQTVLGLALNRRDAYGRGRNGTLPAIDLTGPEYRGKPVYPANFAFYNEQEFTNGQAFINQRFGLFQDRLFLTGGILYYDTKTSSRNVLTGAAPSVLDDAKDMWTASALYKVRDNVSVYYSHSTNASAVIANNAVLWRDGVQDEIGFKTEFFNKRLSFGGAYFEIEQTNVTIPNPARQGDPTQPEQIVADYGNEGWELELMGRVTDQLSIIATYSNLDMRDSLGRRVRAIADHNAAFLANYRFSGEGMFSGSSVYLGVNYSGRRAGDAATGFTLANVPQQPSFYLKADYTTTLGATWHANERLSFRLNVDNVLDRKDYIKVAGGRVAGTGITSAPGRNIRLTTTFTF